MSISKKIIIKIMSTASSGSKTKVVTAQNTREVTITARAVEEEKPAERRPRVKFPDDTVDNEVMGRKSSKGT